MSVSLYYRAARDWPLTAEEKQAVGEIVARHEASFPYGGDERLHLYEHDQQGPSRELIAGSTKLPGEPGRMLTILAHVLDSVTELRRALRGAMWSVDVEGQEVPWTVNGRYELPGMRDHELIAQLAAMEETEDDV